MGLRTVKIEREGEVLCVPNTVFAKEKVYVLRGADGTAKGAAKHS